MTPLFNISRSDRILYFAPHPDDESLGGGGLLQQAVRVGAAVKVVFLTDGDRNPWAQRAAERRWTIGREEQARWGQRRRAESVAALERLGVSKSAAEFLGWPDQGVTALLLKADEAALETICREIAGFNPTLLVLPSAEDTHPDHNAFNVLAQLALSRLSERGRHWPQLTYIVHAPSYPVTGHKVALALSAEEVQIKREAIERHETQMLSRRRFLAHATPLEKFLLPSAPHAESATHPIRSAVFEDGALRLMVELPALRRFGDPRLHVAIESLTEGAVRWTMNLPHRSGLTRIHCSTTGRPRRLASVRVKGRMAEIAIPVWAVQPVGHAYVKLDCRPLFFDFAGWHEVAVAERAGASMFPPRLLASSAPRPSRAAKSTRNYSVPPR